MVAFGRSICRRSIHTDPCGRTESPAPTAPSMTPHQEGPRREPYSPQRVEAFSDGVFAIAVTLLILDVRVPRGLPETTRLIDALLANWPELLRISDQFRDHWDHV